MSADSVLLSDGFVAKKNVILSESVINKHFSCSGGTFEGDVIAQGLKSGDVFLRDGFRSGYTLNSILNLTIGYGCKPFRSLGVAGGLSALGALRFTGADICGWGQWLPAVSVPEHYPQFVSVAYALEALFPVLNFGQLDNWYPGSIWLSVIRWAMTFFGTGLLAILTLFGVGALGPRWRGSDSEGWKNMPLLPHPSLGRWKWSV